MRGGIDHARGDQAEQGETFAVEAVLQIGVDRAAGDEVGTFDRMPAGEDFVHPVIEIFVTVQGKTDHRSGAMTDLGPHAQVVEKAVEHGGGCAAGKFRNDESLAGEMRAKIAGDAVLNDGEKAVAVGGGLFFPRGGLGNAAGQPAQGKAEGRGKERGDFGRDDTARGQVMT